MNERTIFNNDEFVAFIDTATPEELREYFKETHLSHNVNDTFLVELSDGIDFAGNALQYAIYSDKTDASHVQAIIDSGAKVDRIEKPGLHQLYDPNVQDPDENDYIQLSFDPFTDASADKVEVITRAVEEYSQWVNRKYSDAEVYDLLTKKNSSSIGDYFDRHDPNAEITWEYPEKNLRYVGSICGLAAFDEKVDGYYGFNTVLSKGGDPNLLCRVENIDNTENYDELTVTELCHSVDKINRALDKGGLPTEHLLGDVLYGMKEEAADASQFFSVHDFASRMTMPEEQLEEARRREEFASNNLTQLAPLELRLVTEHPDIFEAHHMHGMTNPQAVAEMLLMGHDPSVVNEDGHSLMLGSLLNGKFETFAVLQQFGVVSGPEGQRPMDLVVKHYEKVQKEHVSGSEDFKDWRQCQHAIKHLIDVSDDLTSDLASYMKLKLPDADVIVEMIDRGAVMSDEAQQKYMSRGGSSFLDELYQAGKDAVQDALNRQQRDTIMAEVGEVYTPPTMRRKM
ncbi:TPA: hypothetical protein QEM94_000450 [Stenotrophomonas maltophilia]|nr:hypothetical protein [Stenotrophomonas maltophilia]